MIHISKPFFSFNHRFVRCQINFKLDSFLALVPSSLVAEFYRVLPSFFFKSHRVSVCLFLSEQSFQWMSRVLQAVDSIHQVRIELVNDTKPQRISESE